uniref:Uncharacterized protein MOWOX n=1 Tax=Cyathea australis TaxID=361531 RepID=H8WFA5_9MONI|nr:hypothetical protein [Cyathea australis]
MGEECRTDCNELSVYNSCTSMERLRQQASPLVPRGQGVEVDEAGMVSARMRLLYDYRAPAGTRWSPTTEQLRELQALFHEGGMRTPTTAQISRIAARLRAHGRIEGRNVFYWSQNQKARERKRKLLEEEEEEAISSGGSIGLTGCATHGQAMQQQQQQRSTRQAKATLRRPYEDHPKAAEDERSEVSDSNAAVSAFRAAQSIQYIGNTESGAATCHPPAAVIATRIHMCRDGANAVYDQLDEVESASSTPSARSTSRSGDRPLLLFPLSPQQEEPPLRCCNHIQAQHSSILPPPAPSLTSSLLDLKLAID